MPTTPPSHSVWALLSPLVLASACAFEFSEQPSRPQGSVGAEVFRVVCMNLAAQAFPNDLTGERFSAGCDGQPDPSGPEPAPVGENEQRAALRHRALVARRSELVAALDATFDAKAYRTDELRTFLADMVPLYDPPAQLPELTRSAAKLLTQLVDPKDAVAADAIAALERMSSREGYRPARHGLALTRAMLSYPALDQVLRTTLTAIAPETGPARGPFEDLLRASALDLATAERGAPDPQHPGTLAVATRLLFADDDAFAGKSAPAYLTLRDARGLALPIAPGGKISPPFQDLDGDGLADTNPQGRFVLAGGAPMTPYPMFDSAGAPATRRDPSGRAVDAGGQPLYQSVDANRTLLAGILRDAGPLLEQTKDKRATLLDWTYGLNALLGDYGPRTHTFGKAQFSFQGPDTSQGPAFDLVYALSSVLPFEQTSPLLDVLEQLLRDHEGEVAGLVEAMLYIKERSDAYPDAKWEKPHEFWDDLIGWGGRVATVPGLLENLIRTFTTKEVKGMGPLVGNFMRFKDRVNYPLGKLEELEALGISPKAVVGKLDAPCTGSACGQACNLTNRCPAGTACVVQQVGSPEGKCGSIAEAVAAHRMNVNYPCSSPPTGAVDFLFGSLGLRAKQIDPDADCKPHVDLPAKHHKGFRGCPDAAPQDGASCADAGGFGLCSWDAGSCTCDCDGGLCRHGAKPAWRCTNKPTPGYADFVDRTQPDLTGAEGHGNQSLFQRTLSLVHDLNVPAVFCSKDQASVVLYDPAGSTRNLYDALGGTGLGSVLRNVVDQTALLGPFAECGVIKEPNIIRFYLRADLGYGGLKIQDPTLDNLMGNVLSGLGVDTVKFIDQQTQIRGFSLADPTPEGIGRFVFSPVNPFLDNVFPLGTTRDKLNIVDLHQDTIMSWELEDPIGGLSYLQALMPILKALDPNQNKDEGYISLYADVFSIIHKHWSSRATNSTKRDCDDSTMPPKCNEKTPLFAYQSNGVSYEELVAEGMLDAQLLDRVSDTVAALGKIRLPDGKDGISVLAEAVQNLLLPNRSCLSDDCKAHPLHYRDGRTSSTTNTGKPVPQVAPIYLLLDALNAIDARFEGPNEKRLRPWRDARSKLVDVFFDVERSAPGAWHFKNPRGRAILMESVRFVRERVSEYEAEQAKCAAQSSSPRDCLQVHDWAFGLAPRLEASLAQPVAASALLLLDRLRELDTDPAGKLASLLEFLRTETAGDDTFTATALGTADLLQVLEDTQNLGPVMTFVSRAIAENANDVTAGTAQEADVRNGTVEKAIILLRSLQDLAPESDSQKSTLVTLLARLAKPYAPNGEAPLDAILDTIVAVNRATPGAQDDAPLSAKDLRDLLGETEQFLGSERHGLERLYDVVQARKLP